MDSGVILIAERCVLYQKQQFLLDIKYGGISWHGPTDPQGAWVSFEAWEQCQNLLLSDLERLGATPEELHWIAWELGLQDWWGDSEEFWGKDPRVGTPFEV